MVSTDDPADIRGLITASHHFVVGLPRSSVEGLYVLSAKLPHSRFEGLPLRSGWLPAPVAASSKIYFSSRAFSINGPSISLARISSFGPSGRMPLGPATHGR